MRACLAAQVAYEKSGRPGAVSQLVLFPADRFRPPESVRARTLERRRKRRSR